MSAGNEVAQTGLFRTRLLGLVLLILVPAFALIFISNVSRQKAAHRHARERVTSSAQLAAANQSAYLRQTRQLLATIAQVPFPQARDVAGVERGLRSIRRLSPDFEDLGLIESDGVHFAHSLGSNAPPQIAEPLFRKTIQSRDLALSIFRHPGSATNLSIQFGYPVISTNGEILRVIYASLRPQLLHDALTNVVLPTGGVANVFDLEGNLLARHPDPAGLVGRSLREEPFFQKSVSQRFGAFDAKGLDGRERVYAVSSVEHEGRPMLWVTVGTPREQYFSEVNREFLAGSLFAIFMSAGLLVAARWYADKVFVRPITAILGAADEISDGNLRARANLGPGKTELHLLAKRFDEMAANLEKRQAELARANEELERRVAARTEELEHLNKELEAFSYSVSHDLRAPLRHMDGFAQILLADQSLQQNQRAHRHLNTIATSAKHMGALIDSLLSFSRMGRQSLRKGPVDFAPMVREVINEVTTAEPNRKINWRIPLLPVVHGDATLLRLVWSNLLSNAAKYTRGKDDARIQITHETTDKEDIFHVRDNGAGFDMAYADKLFGVFQRLHRADEFEGTGIGLANVRRIVTRHGGRVWAKGVPDEGAVFSFSIPTNSN